MDEEQRLIKRRDFGLEKRDSEHALVCVNLAQLYFEKEEYEKAIEEYKRAADVYENLKDRLSLARIYRMLGEIYTATAEFTKSLKYIQKYLSISQEEHDLVEEAQAYATLARAYLTRGISCPDNKNDLNLAYEAYSESLEISERLKNKINKRNYMDMKVRCFLNVGIIKEHQGCIDEAIEYMQKSINICNKHDIFDQLHRVHILLGNLYAKQGNNKLAISNINIAINVAKRLSNKSVAMTDAYLAKSDILIKLGDFLSAKQTLHRAYKQNTPNNSDRMLIERNLKIVTAMCKAEDKLITTPAYDYLAKKKLYETLGDGAVNLNIYNAAIDYYLKMLNCALSAEETGTSLLPVYVSLAQTYKDIKDYESALKYFKEDYKINKDINPDDCCQTLLNMAEISQLANKPYITIIKMYKEAEKIARSTGKKALLAKVLKQLIIAEKEYKHLDEVHKLENDLQELNYLSSSSEDESVVDAPDIGSSINLDTITDISSDSDNNEPVNSKVRKRRSKAIKKNNKGESELHVACIQGNLILVTKLLNQGHPVNVRDNSGWTPLHEACNYGCIEIVKLLIEKGASINDRGGTHCQGITPLHDACLNGHLDVVNLLLEKGASPLIFTDAGESPVDLLKNYKERADLTVQEEEQYNIIIKQLSFLIEKAGKSTSIQRKNSCDYAESITSIQEERSFGTSLKRSKVKPTENLHDVSQTGLKRRSKDKIPKAVQLSDTESEESNPECPETNEYRNIMKGLRSKFMDNKKVSNSQNNKLTLQRPALVEDKNDEWLEDDLKWQSSKRKSNSHKKSTSPNLKRRKLQNKDKKSPVFDLENRRSKIYDSGQSDIEIISDENEIPPKRDSSSSLRRIPTQEFLDIQEETNIQSSFYSNRSIIDTNLKAVNVVINKQIWCIPVPLNDLHSLTIEWLVNESTKRYYKKEGIYPILQLKTKAGAILANEDPLSLIFQSDMEVIEIHSDILSWNVPKISEQYVESCYKLKIDVDVTIKTLLEETQLTQQLKLPVDIKKYQIEPLFQSLNQQHFLQKLDISFVEMCSKHINELCQYLPSLTQLKILNFQSICLTLEKLKIFTNMLSKHSGPILEHLEELNISFNPLGNIEITTLNEIFNKLKLRKFSMVNCNLTSDILTIMNRKNINLVYETVQILDISYNFLNGATVSKLLSQLNFSSLINLNIGNNKITNDANLVIETICSKLKNTETSSLKCLNLARCGLNDSCIHQLLTELSTTSSKGIKLDLSENQDLTAATLRPLLENQLMFCKINLFHCSQIYSNFDQIFKELDNFHFNDVIKSISLSFNQTYSVKFIETLIILWMQQWTNKAKVVIKNPILHLSVVD